MKAAVTAIKNVFIGIDTKFDNACLNLERKVCNGHTVDECIESIKIPKITKSKPSQKKSWFKKKDKPTVQQSPEYLRALAEVEVEMREEKALAIAQKKAKTPFTPVVQQPAAPIPTPAPVHVRKESTKITPDSIPGFFSKCKEATRVTPTVVKAIPVTQYCPFCRETMPVEAHYCPHCAGQIIVPIAAIGPAPITACKIKGMPPVSIGPAPKRSLGDRIKSSLNMDVRVAFKPMAKVRVR